MKGNVSKNERKTIERKSISIVCVYDSFLLVC